MTEILTESFCERCGTRYTFESAAPRQGRMGGLKVLGRGLKNFVMSDDSSLDEAFAAARSEADRELTAHQLDAFHQTFNFCMSCRQYTCATCWNEGEARCLSCAPAPEAPGIGEAAIDPERLLRFTGGSAPAASTTAEPHQAPEAGGRGEVPWPDMPWERRPFATGGDQEAAPPLAADTGSNVPIAGAGIPAAEEIAEAQQDDQIGLEITTPHAPAPLAGPASSVPERAEAAFPPDGRLPVAELDAQRAELAASPGFAPGEDLEEAIAAYEASVEAADADRALTPEEPATANAASVEAPTLTNDEVAAGVPPTVEPEPVGPAILEAASPETVSDATSGAPTQTVPVERPPVVAAPPAPRVDVVAQPVWTTTPPPESPAGPETPRPAPSAPAQPAPPAATNAAPQWPTGPRWPTAIPARGAPPAPEPVDSLAALIARPSTEALWAASSREILQPAAAAQAPAVQPCISCGISLSATARFCRRCGTPQQA